MAALGIGGFMGKANDVGLDRRLVQIRWLKVTALVVTAVMMMILSGCTGNAMESEPDKPIDVMTPTELFADPGLRALAEAAQHGNVKKIDALIAKGVNVNGKGRYGETPLYAAFQVRNKRGFKALLEHGANPNFIDANGQTLMNDIAGYSSTYFMKLALKHGGDPNLVAPRSGETPLFFAVAPDGKQNIGLLLRAGANLNMQDKDGYTALMMAAIYNQYDAVYELLEAGADYKLKNTSGHDVRVLVDLSSGTMKHSGSAWKSLQKVIAFLKAHDFWPPPKSQQYDWGG